MPLTWMALKGNYLKPRVINVEDFIYFQVGGNTSFAGEQPWEDSACNTWWTEEGDIQHRYWIKWALTWCNRFFLKPHRSLSLLWGLAVLSLLTFPAKCTTYCARLRTKGVAAFKSCQSQMRCFSLEPTGFHYLYGSQCGLPVSVTAIAFLFFNFQAPWCSWLSIIHNGKLLCCKTTSSILCL